MELERESTTKKDIKERRPAGVTVLALGVLTIAGLHTTRFILSLYQWEFLNAWEGVSSLYLATSGLAWGLLGWCWLWGLWRGLRWAPRFTRLVAPLYAGYIWLERLVPFQRSASGGSLLPTNWPFLAGATVFSLAWVAWILSRPKTRAFFGDVHERES